MDGRLIQPRGCGKQLPVLACRYPTRGELPHCRFGHNRAGPSPLLSSAQTDNRDPKAALLLRREAGARVVLLRLLHGLLLGLVRATLTETARLLAPRRLSKGARILLAKRALTAHLVGWS